MVHVCKVSLLELHRLKAARNAGQRHINMGSKICRLFCCTTCNQHVKSLDCFTQPSLPPMPLVPAPLVSSALAWQQGEQTGQVPQGTAPLQQQQAGLWLGPS